MTARRSGLGKGLGALIPNAEDGATGDSALRELDIDLIQPNQFQPRGHFDDDALASLTASIRVSGVLQPVLVRPHGDHFELIAGERRWRAAKAAGLVSIPALVRDITDSTSLEQALIENLHREDLSALEEAAAYQQLVDDFSLSHEQVGQRAGKSRSTVANSIRLLQLPPGIQGLVNDRSLSAGHARALLALESSAEQESLAERIVADGLSVRGAEDAVRELHDRGSHPAPEAAANPPARARERPPGLVELEEALSEHLDTKVKIDVGARQRGKVILTFAGFDDLDRLCRVIQHGREPAL